MKLQYKITVHSVSKRCTSSSVFCYTNRQKALKYINSKMTEPGCFVLVESQELGRDPSEDTLLERLMKFHPGDKVLVPGKDNTSIIGTIKKLYSPTDVIVVEPDGSEVVHEIQTLVSI